MASEQREVGGLWCRDVMALLPDYVDGALPAGEIARLVAHVQGCDLCERFGGAYGGVVQRLRASAMPRDASDRLMAALDAELRR